MAERDSPGGLMLRAWRHPVARGATGRCIGQTDLPVCRRKAKRLAHRMRKDARRLGLIKGGARPVVRTSPLTRCLAVGKWLRRWGWRMQVDADLMEMDFGRWDGQPWSAISQDAVDAWCADFADHAPGDGESLRRFLARAACAWRRGASAAMDLPGGARVVIVVAHGGWINAMRWSGRPDTTWSEGAPVPPAQPAAWPAAPPHGALTVLSLSPLWPLTPCGGAGSLANSLAASSP